MAGLTAAGFERRTYDEIVQDKITMAQNLFGADINTEENTPLGKFIRINAYDEALISEDMELVYYSIFPNTASGVSLDRLCTFIGISRNPATAARYKVTVSGTAGEIIPMEFLVGTESGIEYHNVNDVEIGSDGKAELLVDCTELGDIGNVAASDISQIVNPVTGVDSIDSVELVSTGSEEESDYNLRKRFEMSRDGLGSTNAPSVINSILRVPTVTSVGIVENATDSTDSDGRPPHSFQCYVNGGNDYHKQIAESILERKPLGIQTYGDVSETVTDSAGTTHTIKFSHSQTLNIYVKASIKTNASFENTGISDIKSKIIFVVRKMI